MEKLRSIVKSVLPWRMQQLFRATYRSFIFRRAFKQFLKDPGACAQVGNPLLKELIYGWGNEEWSGLEEYLIGSITHAQTATGPILECGSGLSTLMIGAIAKQRGIGHWALEHTPLWASRVQQHLNKHRLDSVTLCTCHLQSYGAYEWYSPPLSSMPDSFALVICDGPPSSTKGGRYGLVPVMKDRLKSGCIILLDDAGRDQERSIANRWEVELGATLEILGVAKPYAKLTVRDVVRQK